jgi:hypothetical protein
MSINVFNPAHPGDRTHGVALSKAQFDICHDYMLERLNAGRPIDEATILRMLRNAGDPVIFKEDSSPG